MRECSGANTWVRPYDPPNVGANLVFALSILSGYFSFLVNVFSIAGMARSYTTTLAL